MEFYETLNGRGIRRSIVPDISNPSIRQAVCDIRHRVHALAYMRANANTIKEIIRANGSIFS